MQGLQLVLDLGLGLAANLLPDPLPVRAEAERYDAAPTSGADFVVAAVTAVTGVVEVDAVFAVATPTYGSYATTWLPEWLPKMIKVKRRYACELLGLGGAEGFETLTPSMRTERTTRRGRSYPAFSQLKGYNTALIPASDRISQHVAAPRLLPESDMAC